MAVVEEYRERVQQLLEKYRGPDSGYQGVEA